ncbi:family 2A encapsulin nanocompartment cargo protein cysteine desulfurase [Arcobacter sp. CECT 9188]|uniref:family 2A encapsulin nanocompartment cargo protein cysteine desulfurase n=1 Tax=Arcobacter sp. CECT 9188 TaxID=2044505 RepID=UPI000DE95BDF|nr:family 2A encapsulin nanocompartment cargo protein cysteine desulfurase [Arcobacter sp. CECT 9188]RBQ26080.1 cysteine desulfurase [Arcobacter sp. CECT 9188]
MITHNNLPNFDEEFYKNQIEILANQAFPEFNSNPNDIFNEGFDYEKVIQTNFYENKDVSNFETFSNIQIAPQNNSYDIFDVEAIRKDFPVLNQKVNGGYPLIWLDNAATTQKPKSVIDRISHFYEYENSNIHRGAHTLAARATDAYEDARKKVAKFVNAPSENNIIFVRGATEAINLIAHSFGKFNIQKDDEIIVSNLEHHANIVPWQILSQEVGSKIKVIPVDNDGQILLNEFERLITSKTKIVSIAHVSNALGTIVPIKQVVEIAHRYGVKVLIDGAQGVSHIKTDVQDIDCDFYVFSGHKVFAPTGIGAIYAKKELLDIMKPYQSGGNMIADVTFEKTIYQDVPNKFEAGTGNIADAVGLGAAIDYINKIGIENIYRYEHELLGYAISKMSEISGLRFIGTAKEKTSVLSFVLDGYDTTKVGEYLTSKGIALRFGHHCAQPILRRFGVETTVRPSIAFYNTKEEIDFLVKTIKEFKNS